MDRVKRGYPITPLELTALSFTVIMFATSVCWYLKPSITYPQTIHTRVDENSRQATVQSIREFAREEVRRNLLSSIILTLMADAKTTTQTHPYLPDDPDDWHRTPLDFISRRPFGFEVHRAYYTRLSEIIRFHIFSRPMKQKLWDRIPPDIWFPIDGLNLVLSIAVAVIFGISFMFGWNFYFPSPAERLFYRIFSVVHLLVMVFGAVYYIIEARKSMRRRQRYVDAPAATTTTVQVIEPESQRTHLEACPQMEYLYRFKDYVRATIRSWRNISEHKDPDMAVPLRVVWPITVPMLLYTIGRIYLYVEIFVTLRQQPKGIYVTGNRFLPFFG